MKVFHATILVKDASIAYLDGLRSLDVPADQIDTFWATEQPASNRKRWPRIAALLAAHSDATAIKWTQCQSHFYNPANARLCALPNHLTRFAFFAIDVGNTIGFGGMKERALPNRRRRRADNLGGGLGLPTLLC